MRCRVFCSILSLILILSVGVVLVPALSTCAAEDPASPGPERTDPNVELRAATCRSRARAR